MVVNRSTFSSGLLLIQDNLLRVQRDYQKASVPATSGMKINNLYDDSRATSRVFSLRSQTLSNEQYQKNVTQAELKLNFMDSRLSQSNEALQRFREIVLRANDPTVDGTTLTQLSNQLTDLKTEILGYTNARLENRYVFSGTKTSTQPFTGATGVFNGNAVSVTAQVTSAVTITTTLNGQEIFGGSGGGEDVFDAINTLITAVAAGSTATIATELTNLDTAIDQVQKGRADVGIRLQQLSAVQNQLAEDNIRLATDLSNLQDADIDKAISTLVTRETAMRLVFATSSQVLGALSGIQLNA